MKKVEMEKSVKKINTRVELKYFNVYFAYDTIKKGYYREGHRVIIAEDKALAKAKFKEWSKKVRTMSNAEILGIFEDESKNMIIDV